MKWKFENIPNLIGKTVIVTGGNSGIGYEISRMSAAKGASVIIATRNFERGQKAVESIQRMHPNTKIETIKLDLASLNSIESFVEDFKTKYSELHYLFNNAGIMAVPFSTTEDGFERQLGTNHLGHFALTGRLLDYLIHTTETRVITVSSGAHRSGEINFDDILMENDYSRFSAYSRSKFANIVFAYELQRRFESNGIRSLSLATHPGLSRTNLAFQENGMISFPLFKFVTKIIFGLMSQSAKMGSLPQLYAAFSPDSKGGGYYGPGGFREIRGYPKEVKSIPTTYDTNIASKLWDISEELTGVKYKF